MQGVIRAEGLGPSFGSRVQGVVLRPRIPGGKNLRERTPEKTEQVSSGSSSATESSYLQPQEFRGCRV